jgi:hypothetical protein
MITPPSAAFTTAANAADRYPKMRVTALFTDPFVQSGNIVTSDDVNNFCDLDSGVVDDLLLHVADTILETPHKYVINDGTWINDGTFCPVPGTITEAAYNQVGWYTDEVCDGDGNFEGDPNPPEITVTFAEERTINTLLVVGEPTLGEYPTDFDVLIYDEDDNLLNSITNFTGTEVEKIIDFSSDNIITAKYMKLVLHSWSATNTIGKIVEFFGVLTQTFTGSDIISADILEELEADEEESPYGVMSCDELTIELQNVVLTVNGSDIENPFLPENENSPFKNSVSENVRFTPELGFMLPGGSIEYVPMGIFWSLPWDVSESNPIATVTARDRLYILSKNYFVADKILTDTNLKEIAEYVLNHAKVNIPLNDIEWDVDASLEGFGVDYAWLGRVTYFEALNKIASACMGRCYCNRYGVIVIESYISDDLSGSPAITISHGMCFDKDRPPTKVYNRIIVPVCPLVPQEESEEIYTSESIPVAEIDTIITQEVKWEDDAVYEFSDVIPTGTGVTMIKTGEQYFPQRAVLTFTKVAGTAGSFTFKITGKKLIPVVGIDPITLDDAESQLKHDVSVHELKANYLIQSSTTATAIATYLLASLKDGRRDISVEIQGNPCYEPGDNTNIETYFKTTLHEEFRTIRYQYKINDRGLRCNITAKKLVSLGD